MKITTSDIEKELGENFRSKNTQFIYRFLKTKISIMCVGLQSVRKLTPVQCYGIVSLMNEKGITKEEILKITKAKTIEFVPYWVRKRVKSVDSFNKSTKQKIEYIFKNYEALKSTQDEKTLWEIYRRFYARFASYRILVYKDYHVEFDENEPISSIKVPYSKGLWKVVRKQKLTAEFRLYMAMLATYQYKTIKTNLGSSAFEHIIETHEDMFGKTLGVGALRNRLTKMIESGIWMNKVKKRGNWKLRPWKEVVLKLTGENRYKQKKFLTVDVFNFEKNTIRFELGFLYRKQLEPVKAWGTWLFLSLKRFSDELGYRCRRSIYNIRDVFRSINGTTHLELDKLDYKLSALK